MSLPALLSPDPPADLIAIHAGKPEIDEEEIIGCPRKGFEGGAVTIGSDVSLQAFVQQIVPDDDRQLLIVFYDKDFGHVTSSQFPTIPYIPCYKERSEVLNPGRRSPGTCCRELQ